MTYAVAYGDRVVGEFHQPVLQDLQLAANVQQETADKALAGNVHQAGSGHAYQLVNVHGKIHSR